MAKKVVKKAKRAPAAPITLDGWGIVFGGNYFIPKIFNTRAEARKAKVASDDRIRRVRITTID